MNLLFQTRKPRRFHHEMIYSDERRERLERMEERAKEELGMKEGMEAKEPARSISFVTERRQKFRSRGGLLSSDLGLAFLLLILFTLVLLMIL